jgi:hypothetical protein
MGYYNTNNTVEYYQEYHGILGYQKSSTDYYNTKISTVRCDDATVTPWNVTILKNHHGILQYQNSNIKIKRINAQP